MKSIPIIVFLIILSIASLIKGQEPPIYLDCTKSNDIRIRDLIFRMTLEEKVSQLINKSPSIPRLNVPAYDWWNECLHGVARSGVATVFPQAIGMAATFDDSLIYRVAEAISDEARAMYQLSINKGYRQQYSGLTFWTPNVNIFRDPRWGRGQETYGEDPYLTATLGTAFVLGLQGNNPKYLKIAACAKHFAVHSGPEKLRHEFNAEASLKDMNETYLPAFKSLVEAGVEIVMCAYNRTNGEPCCGSNKLLINVLRNRWKFKGHIVTDCGALVDFFQGHKVTTDPAQSAALAIKSGVNLECGNTFLSLPEAVNRGLINETEIDKSLAILLRTRFKLGMFDPDTLNPYTAIDPAVINSDKHRQLAYETAVKSIVLLKNDGVLPLKSDLPLYFITGPLATDANILLGNYYGANDKLVTFFEGIASRISPYSQLEYRQGCLFDRSNINPVDWISGLAARADATIICLGISSLIEGEEGESLASSNFGDRLDYNIPSNQLDYLKKLRGDHKKAIIAVITGGSPLNLAEVEKYADAVLFVWYPGEEGGNALADIIFGKVSPSGRLPITFPKSYDQLPPFEDYSMKGRTYKYMKEEPLYPFGYGLSYTHFEYSANNGKQTRIKRDQTSKIDVIVKNSGLLASDEVIQLYISALNSAKEVPLYSLKSFCRIHLNAGQSQLITFTITPDMLATVRNDGALTIEKGTYKIYIAGSLPSLRSLELGMPVWVETELIVY